MQIKLYNASIHLEYSKQIFNSNIRMLKCTTDIQHECTTLIYITNIQMQMCSSTKQLGNVQVQIYNWGIYKCICRMQIFK